MTEALAGEVAHAPHDLRPAEELVGVLLHFVPMGRGLADVFAAQVQGWAEEHAAFLMQTACVYASIAKEFSVKYLPLWP